MRLLLELKGYRAQWRLPWSLVEGNVKNLLSFVCPPDSRNWKDNNNDDDGSNGSKKNKDKTMINVETMMICVGSLSLKIFPLSLDHNDGDLARASSSSSTSTLISGEADGPISGPGPSRISESERAREDIKEKGQCVCTLCIVPMAMCVLVYVWVSVRDDFELTRANVFGRWYSLWMCVWVRERERGSKKREVLLFKNRNKRKHD